MIISVLTPKANGQSCYKSRMEQIWYKQYINRTHYYFFNICSLLDSSVFAAVKQTNRRNLDLIVFTESDLTENYPTTSDRLPKQTIKWKSPLGLLTTTYSSTETVIQDTADKSSSSIWRKMMFYGLFLTQNSETKTAHNKNTEHLFM